MAGRERGVIKMVWKSFIASLKPNFMRTKLIGEDYYGTKYYEVAVPSYSSRRRPSRYFVPVNKNDHEQELPAEWESWLRYRRKEPPTQDELERNYQLAITKKQNAAEIEALYSETQVKKLDVPVEKRGAASFPVYEEYKNDGRDYKVKIPRY